MRIFIILILLWSVCISAFSQDPRVVDSVDALLVNKSSSERYTILRQMAIEYVGKDNQRALDIARMAAEEASNMADSAAIVTSGRMIGQILNRLGKVEEAISVLMPMKHVRNYPGELVAILNSLGVSCVYLGRFDEALVYYFGTIAIAEKQGDSTYLSVGLKNLGLAYYKLKDYAKALPLLVRSYSLEKALDDINHMTPMNISLCYYQLKDYKRARRFLKESIALCGARCSTISLIHIQYAMGCIYLGEGKADSARTAFENSLRFATEKKEPRMQLDNIYFLADIHAAEKNFLKAEKYLKKGEDIITSGTPFNIEKIKIYFSLAELYLTLKDFEKASSYQSRYITLRDSIYDESLTTKLIKVESEYLSRENRLKLAAQEERILLKEEVIQKQKALSIATTILAITALGLCMVLYRSYRAKKDLNKLLEHKVRERTIALEESRDSLLRSVNEKDLLLKRVTNEFLNTAYAIEGLCHTGGQEGFGPQVTSYFIRIRTALNGVGAYSNSVESDTTRSWP